MELGPNLNVAGKLLTLQKNKLQLMSVTSTVAPELYALRVLHGETLGSVRALSLRLPT